jgi:lipopolysaccharide export system permease protein
MIKILINNFHMQNSKIGRYINFKLFSIFLAINIVISLVVFGNQFVLRVKDSAESGIPFMEIMPIIFLNTLRDIPLIVTLSLFLSIIITFNQLYKNSEAIAIHSIGLGKKQFGIMIQPIVIIIFSIMLIFTSYIIPAAKFEKNIIESQAKNASEFSFITEGQFEEFKNGEIVFFASQSDSIDNDNFQNMEEIFIYSLNNNDPIIVVASEAIKYINQDNKGTYLRLKNGKRYQGFPGSENKKILDFDSYDLEIVSGKVKDSLSTSSTIESSKTSDLLIIGNSLAWAEFQWRISQPISLIILSFLGIILGETSPRKGKNLGLIFGLIIFILYNNLLMIIKNSIENESLNPFIGLFLAHFFVLVIIFMVYRLINLNFIYYVDKIPFFKKTLNRYV